MSYAILGALALIAAGGAYVYFRGAKGAAADVVNAAGNTIAGIAEGIGDQLGVPRTDAEKCAAAMSAGQKYEASKYCDAGTFLKWAIGGFSSPGTPLATSKTDAGYRRYELGDVYL